MTSRLFLHYLFIYYFYFLTLFWTENWSINNTNWGTFSQKTFFRIYNFATEFMRLPLPPESGTTPVVRPEYAAVGTPSSELTNLVGGRENWGTYPSTGGRWRTSRLRRIPASCRWPSARRAPSPSRSSGVRSRLRRRDVTKVPRSRSAASGHGKTAQSHRVFFFSPQSFSRRSRGFRSTDDAFWATIDGELGTVE